MDEGSLQALGVLIIHCSVVGSELTISPRLYPRLMIWVVPLSVSLQLLWPNKEKREGKKGFYSSDYATFTINIPQSLLFYVAQSRVTSVTCVAAGMVHPLALGAASPVLLKRWRRELAAF